ncbi:MAG: hypothetical protein V1709_09815 [Planctomycetota bacterium]
MSDPKECIPRASVGIPDARIPEAKILSLTSKHKKPQMNTDGHCPPN